MAQEVNNGLVDGDTISIDIESGPEGNILTFADGTMTWQAMPAGGLVYGPDYDSDQHKGKTMKENFIEHFDICGPGGAVIERILKKKHSERTEEEKENIRWLMRQDKPEKPKINIPDNPGVPDGLIYYDATTGMLNLADRNYVDNQVLDADGNYPGAQL